MADQARRLGKNRILTTTRQTRRVFEKAVGNHRSRLRSLQFDAVEIPEVMDNFFHGLVDNLYNTALDMLVESRLYQNAAPLRASQLISLDARLVANVEMTIGIGVDEIMPDCVYQAGIALDCAYALLTDSLYGGKTDYASPYRSLDAFVTGKKLFETWQKAMSSWLPGDEYALVDTFARILKLEGWYVWKADKLKSPRKSTPSVRT